jgi:hypothetical protein
MRKEVAQKIDNASRRVKSLFQLKKSFSTGNITSADRKSASIVSASNSQRASLGEHDVNALVKSTSMSREQILDFYADFLRDCPNGRLSKKEFIKMFNKTDGHKADEFCAYVFKYLTFLSVNSPIFLITF